MLLVNYWNNLVLVVVGVLFLSSCTFLSNRAFLEQYPGYRGIKRVAIFLRRWPCYQQLPEQRDLGADFIRKTTRFYGPWEPARPLEPRAVDIEDINDNLVGELLLEALEKKGYQPFWAEVSPFPWGAANVEEIMARYQAFDIGVDAFLFCYYSPVIYVTDAGSAPPEHGRRSYGLQEIVEYLHPGGDYVTWAGPRASLAPPRAVSHAFIYISLTMFRALDWRPYWEIADSQIGGRLRVALTNCPPGPTDQNYRASAAIIQRLMVRNLQCRLHHLIPDSF